MKIWLDFCEPKSITMLRPLYEHLEKNHEIFITARDFDSTIYLLDQWGVEYIPVGSHGGGTLIGKLKAYSDRIAELIEVVDKEKPDFLFCITSPEAIRVAFGLQLPHIMFNDEPRSFGCCALTLPLLEKVIVPKCIPIEWYYEYGIKPEKVLRFNGIDEVAWLNPDYFQPDKKYLAEFQLEPSKYTVLRTEPTTAGYLMDKMGPHETKLTEILPRLLEDYPELKHLVITRTPEQFENLGQQFKEEISEGTIILRSGVSNLAHIMYYAKMVLTGCGTMVRESALLGVPSIEFFPLDTYPQEQFLIDNGFPLRHIRDADSILEAIQDYLDHDYRQETADQIRALENPIELGISQFDKWGLKTQTN